MSWLIIAEKDLAARRIAEILFGNLKVIKNGKVKIYYSAKKDAYVIGLKGHLLELDFPDDLNDWRTPIEKLLSAKFVRKVKEKEIYDTLKKLAENAERVTIATDYDREGELIGLEAFWTVKKVNSNVKFNRVKFSAVTKEEILKAFSNPTQINYKLAEAAIARQKIDLLWGAILTRILSTSAESDEVLSAGRVQTPTLRLIVEREKEIREFKPEKYYELTVFFEKFSAKQIFKNKSDLELALSKIKDFGIVRKFEKKVVEENKPIPFNTTEFLSEASKFMSPDKAMEIAENLYMKGYISYPRTDNTVYPESLDLVSTVKEFLKSEFSKEAEIVLSEEIVPSRGRKKTEDHPPIHPTSVASKSELKRDEWTIYELVVRRFLATLAPKAVWEVRKAEIDCGITLPSSGKIMLKPGWRAITGFDEIEFPELSIGQNLKILKKDVKEKKTKPPSRYSASSLIKLMESLNLGTKSTRHEIIKKLVSRNYIKGDPFRPTELAFSVVNVLKKFAEKITLPDMTAELEKEMDDIERGLKGEEEVFQKSKVMLESILRSLNHEELSRELKMGILKEKSLGKCLKCEGELILKFSKMGKRFLGCVNYPNCNFSIPLPQKGKILKTSKLCEKHGLKIIKIDGKRICPYCNYLKWRGEGDG